MFKFSNNKSSKKLRIGFRGYHFFMALYKKPMILTAGLTNETEDLRYVPFIDYDNINYDKVVKECRALIKTWGLSGLAILESKAKSPVEGHEYGNYHVIGLDKLTFINHVRLLDDTCCDFNFRRVPKFFRYKHWVLRIYPKFDDRTWKKLKGIPRLKCWIEGSNRCRFKQSKAHYQFLRTYYGLKPLYLHWDKFNKLNIIRYNTTSR